MADLDPVSYLSAQQALASARKSRLQMARRAGQGTGLSSGAQASFMARVSMSASPQCDWSQITVTWANVYGLSLDGPSDLTIRAAIEYPSGTYHPLWWPNGSRDMTLVSGAQATTLPLPIGIPAGAQFWLRYYVQAAGGTTQWPTSNMPFSQNLSELFASPGSDLTLGTNTGLSTATGSVPFPPIRVQGFPERMVSVSAATLGQTLSGVAIWGDSISNGTGDTPASNNDFGFLQRGLTSLCGWIALGQSSISVSQNATDVARRRRMLALVGCTHVVTNFGTNDIGSGRTAAQVISDMGGFETAMRRNGCRLVLCTLTPRTDAANSGGFQGSDTTSTLAELAAYNAWVRTDPFGYGVIDSAAAAADPVTPRNWRTDLGTPTADGLHPASVIHQAMAAAVTAAMPGILARR